MISVSPLPDPLVPADIDLRDFCFMPLDVVRLRDSGTAALVDPEAFRCAILSWCAAWHQKPAGSLPDDDAELAILLGYGRTGIAIFKTAREAGGLRGWVLCSDGRLYHPVVAEKAIEAWSKMQSFRARSKAGNEARWGKRQDKHGDQSTIAEGSHRDRLGIASGSQKDPKGEDKTGQERVRTRGTRLPADWQPSSEDRAFADQHGLDWQKIAASFVDYWVAQAGGKAVKASWPATWRTWCRNEVTPRKDRATARGGNTAQFSRSGGVTL